MRRFLTVSTLLALAIMATTVTGQPPAGQDVKPKPKSADDKQQQKPTPTDAAIAAALAHDPDVRLAQAKIQLAEAELAKARQTVTLKIVSLKAKIDQLKLDVRGAEDRMAWSEQMFKKGIVDQSRVLTEREKLEAATGALAAAETEWKLLTGGAIRDAKLEIHDDVQLSAAAALLAAAGDRQRHYDEGYAKLLVQARLALRGQQSIKGPIPDRLRAVLDKPVKLGEKGTEVTFAQAMEVFKKGAGLDVPAREIAKVAAIRSEGEELPIGAWFQLFADNNPDVRFVVREYGILVTLKDAAPPDAISIVEFWKQKPAAKDAKTEPKTNPGGRP